MRTVLAALLLSVGAGTALAQGDYTFEMRLIADGDAGAPNGNWPFFSIRVGGEGGPANRIGFWLQARVAQTSGENWGIVRASSPEGGVSFISVTSPGTMHWLSRGQINNPANPDNRLYGRGRSYTASGGDPTGNTGNPSGSAPFPGTAGNENGGLDNGGSGSHTTRIYAFDSYIGSTRNAIIDEDDVRTNPWGVNGASSWPSLGNPVPSDGTFSPWANLYRVLLDYEEDPLNWGVFGVTINASALLCGAIQAVPNEDGDTWEMQTGPGQLMTASYTFYRVYIPTPGAACALALGGLFASRRRR